MDGERERTKKRRKTVVRDKPRTVKMPLLTQKSLCEQNRKVYVASHISSPKNHPKASASPYIGNGCGRWRNPSLLFSLRSPYCHFINFIP